MLKVDEGALKDWGARRNQIQEADGPERDRLLSERSKQTRRDILNMISKAKQGHIGGDFSVTDILTVLFNAVLDVSPEDPARVDRDRFVLSKGHCAAALYATLASAGYFSQNELTTFMESHSALNGHPNRNKVPGVETNTGPLGHGLPVAVGIAIGSKLQGYDNRVVAVMGDGEMQEGSNWEALMAGRQHKLDNLVAIIDRNRLQQGARTEETNGLDPLGEKLAAFGWETREVDGHDFGQLIEALQPSTTGLPVAVVANTVKGRGVSFIEDRVEWHHKVPSPEQVTEALKELA